MTTYTISTGQHDSILDIRRERTGHESIASALAAIARVAPVALADLVSERGDDGVTRVYLCAEDAAADDDGSSAFASISAEQS